MKNNPLVSVVIPVYKNKGYARRAIHSVIVQTIFSETSIEIIVSDDDTKDNRKFYERINKCVKYYKNGAKHGPASNRQNGFLKAKGEYIVFLDSDDTLKKDFLEKSLKYINKGKYSATVSLSKTIFEESISPKTKVLLTLLVLLKKFFLLLSYLVYDSELAPGLFYLCQVSHMLFRHSEIEKLSFSKFNYGEDWYFVSKLMVYGKIKIIPMRLIDFHYHGSSISSFEHNSTDKWVEYRKLLKHIPKTSKRNIFYLLFLVYIKLMSRQ